MKRLLTLLVTICLLFSLPFHSSAASDTDKNIIYLNDGYYIIVTTESIDTRATNTKSGSRSFDCYNSNNELEWKAVLSGTFTYNGTSATCTASSCNTTIYNTNWYEISNTASKSGSTASATVTMGRKFLGITIEKETHTISLSCDKNGVLS